MSDADRLETAIPHPAFTTDHGVQFPAAKQLSTPACLGDIKEFDKDNLTPALTSVRPASFLYTSEALANMVKTFDRTNLKSAKTMDTTGTELTRQKVKVDIESFNRWCLENVEVNQPKPSVTSEIVTFDQTSLNKTQTPVKVCIIIYNT